MVHPAPLGGESPDEHQPRGALNEAVHAEPEERDGAREQRGRDAAAALDQVPANGQVLQLQCVAQATAACVEGDGDGHGPPTSSRGARSGKLAGLELHRFVAGCLGSPRAAADGLLGEQKGLRRSAALSLK